jgi:hypothetical protein
VAESSQDTKRIQRGVLMEFPLNKDGCITQKGPHDEF